LLGNASRQKSAQPFSICGEFLGPLVSLFLGGSSPPFSFGIMAGSNFVVFGISRRSICDDYWGGSEYNFGNRVK
jgi:hypothetical protein